MARYSVKIPRLDGGLNTKESPFSADLTQSPDSQNMIYDDLGAIATVTGNTAFTTGGIAAFPIDGLFSYVKNDGTAKLLTVCADSLYRMSGNTAVTIPSAQSVFTHEIPVHSINYQNQAWFSDGYASPYKYNGTEFTRWGVIATSPIGSCNVNSAGTLTGNYAYVILGINTNSVMGNYSSACTATDATAHKIYLQNIPVFPTSAGVNYKAICRNTAGASGIYYIVTQIANATTVYLDNNSDSTLLTLAPTDNGLPQNFTTFIEYKGRIYGASESSTNPDYLWYSEQNSPETFLSSNFKRIGEGDGQAIRSLAVFSNGIIIGKDDGKGNGSVWKLNIRTSDMLGCTIEKLDTPYGSNAFKNLPLIGNRLVYLNKYGAYDLNESAPEIVSTDPISYEIEPDINAISTTYLNKSFAINWKNKLYISVPYGASQATNNRMYVYDYIKGKGLVSREQSAWSKITSVNFANLTQHQGDLYAGSSASDGYIYKLEDGYTNHGTAIDAYFETMKIQGKKGHENNTKVWRYVYVTVYCSGDWNVTLTYSIDDDPNTQSTANINVYGGGAEWGLFDWGMDDWGAAVTRKKVMVEFTNLTGRYLKLKFSNSTSGQYFKIYDIECFYNLKTLR